MIHMLYVRTHYIVAALSREQYQIDAEFGLSIFFCALLSVLFLSGTTVVVMTCVGSHCTVAALTYIEYGGGSSTWSMWCWS